MRRLTDEEFARLFETFRSSAFRLETLQSFAEDDATFAAWRRGEDPPPDEGMLAWDATVLAARNRGARFERVRLVVEPASPYVRWELGAYARGEDIRVLAVEPDDPRIGDDWWLLDCGVADWERGLGVRMEYDADGCFIAGHATRDTARMRRMRAELTAASIPLAEYLAGAGVRG